MERYPPNRASPKFRCRMYPTVTQRPFSPPSFPARRKRRGRRRRVRNDHDGTSRRKRRLFSSVLVSSFPNRKLNLRFGFFLCKSATTSQARSLCHYWYASSPERGALGGSSFKLSAFQHRLFVAAVVFFVLINLLFECAEQFFLLTIQHKSI